MTDIHGILALKPVFQAEKEILPGIMSGRNLYCHWAVLPFDAENGREGMIPLQSGDCLKIFRTAAEGPVEWKGVINLEHKRRAPDTGEQEYDFEMGVHGLQKDVSAKTWGAMFGKERPAILTRGDQIHQGNLMPFAETGTEGVIWSLQEWEKLGYDGLQCLKDGDRLKVLSHVTSGETVFDGKLTLMPKFTEAAYSDYYKEKFQLRPMEIMPNVLMTYCVQHLPVIVSRPS